MALVWLMFDHFYQKLDREKLLNPQWPMNENPYHVSDEIGDNISSLQCTIASKINATPQRCLLAHFKANYSRF